MAQRTRLIKVDGSSIFFTPDFYIEKQKTNLPDSLVFHRRHPFFWKVSMHNYDRTTGYLELEVMDFYPSDSHGFGDQIMKASVNNVCFRRLNWGYLEPFLSAYRKEDLHDLIVDSEEIHVPDQNEWNLEFSIKVYVKDLRIRLGYDSFEQYVDRLNEVVEIRVENHHLLPEFDLIKSFFARQLKRKTVLVDVEMTIKGTQVTKVKARSKQIDRINDAMVSSFKLAQIRDLRKKELVHAIDKSLFTSDEAFDSLNEDGGNLLNLRVEDIIATMAEHGMVRNRKQLEYLAGKKQLPEQEIRMTTQPLFGFVFLVRGEQMLHFCWELIDSHATYIWSFDQNAVPVIDAWKRLELIIQDVRLHGRDTYKRSALGGIKDDFLFQVIIHKYAGSKTKDPFPMWRQRLEEVLV